MNYSPFYALASIFLILAFESCSSCGRHRSFTGVLVDSNEQVERYRQDDGSILAVMSAAPHSYVDGDGKVRPIDTTLKKTKEGFVNETNSVKSFLPLDPSQGLRWWVEKEAAVAVTPQMALLSYTDGSHENLDDWSDADIEETDGGLRYIFGNAGVALDVAVRPGAMDLAWSFGEKHFADRFPRLARLVLLMKLKPGPKAQWMLGEEITSEGFYASSFEVVSDPSRGGFRWLQPRVVEDPLLRAMGTLLVTGEAARGWELQWVFDGASLARVAASWPVRISGGLTTAAGSVHTVWAGGGTGGLGIGLLIPGYIPPLKLRDSDRGQKQTPGESIAVLSFELGWLDAGVRVRSASVTMQADLVRSDVVLAAGSVGDFETRPDEAVQSLQHGRAEEYSGPIKVDDEGEYTLEFNEKALEAMARARAEDRPFRLALHRESGEGVARIDPATVQLLVRYDTPPSARLAPLPSYRLTRWRTR